MKLKSTLIGAGVITLMCGGALYAVNAPSDLIEGPHKEVTYVSKSAKSSSDKHNSSSHSARGRSRNAVGESIKGSHPSSQTTQEAKEGGPNMDQGNEQGGVAGSNGQVSGPSVSQPTGTAEPAQEENESVGDTSTSAVAVAPVTAATQGGTPYQRGVDPYTDPEEQAKLKALQESVMSEQASHEAQAQSQHSAEQEAMRKYKAEHPELFGNGQ